MEQEQIQIEVDQSNDNIQSLTADYVQLSSGERSWIIDRKSFTVERQFKDEARGACSQKALREEVHGEKDESHSCRGNFKTASLALASLGVVFGDIGTSPLYTPVTVYAFLSPKEDNVLGVTSCMIWLVMIVVTLKYVLIIMRHDNMGQGGIMALTTLASKSSNNLSRPWWKTLTLLTGVLGCTLFFGDSIITPAISVLSALEGVSVASSDLADKTMPMAIGVLLILFLAQRFGTGRVGSLLGPIMLLWFLMIAVTGIEQIVQEPRILAALNPWSAAIFLNEQALQGSTSLFSALGTVVLSVTGGEALYADMGHFGAPAIRYAWFLVVLPSVTLSYLGQGALALRQPTLALNPFWNMFPSTMVIPVVVLSTLATMIASNSCIAGTFSLTNQAIKLGFLPRMEVRHMSSTEAGQIYIPLVNNLLMVAVVTVTAAFRTSTALAAAFGMSVTATMLLDGLLTSFVGTRWLLREGWVMSVVPWIILMLCIHTIDALLVVSCAYKFLEGAWLPVVIGLFVFIIMTTWWNGCQLLVQRLRGEHPPLLPFIKWMASECGAAIVTGRTAVFLVQDDETAPQALLLNLRHSRVRHATCFFVRETFTEEAHVSPEKQLMVEELGEGCWRIGIRYGFKDTPDIPAALVRIRDVQFDPKEVSYFLSRSIVVPGDTAPFFQLPCTGINARGSVMPMGQWRKRFFCAMYRSAASSVGYYCLPQIDAVELGFEVEI